MKNCSGINCPMQYGVVDAATCPAVECCPNATPPLTNYDRIVSKTPGELAEWIASVTQGGDGSCAPGCHYCNGKTSCTESWLEWLMQEVEM